MEEKYYFISYIWTDLGNNFYSDGINIHPIEWLERVNKSYYDYKDKNGKIKTVYTRTKFNLLNWIEISKEEYLTLVSLDKGYYLAKEYLELSYGNDPA